jgi:phosphoribosylformylglycinamidine cyclo-ligase
LITGSAIIPGDVLIGISSSGVHSNGYSLVRKIVFGIAGHQVDDHIPELGETVADALLRPTLIYSAAVRKILAHYRVKDVVHGIAHITGGGLGENIERILPPNVDIQIDCNTWKRPPVFPWMQRLGNVATDEMYRVFNMGIGLVLIVRPRHVEAICRMLERDQLQPQVIGKVVSGTRQVVLSNQ